VEREAVLVGIDVGTTKVVALIGEVGRDGGLTIIGKGTVPASGLRKGVVVNIDQTVHSITAAVEKAERHSGWKIDRAFVSVGGQHVDGLNSPGQVAVAGPRREVTQEDVNRSIEVARAVSIPSTREVLHVVPRGYTVDGQEGVMNPLGMSAVRLEVETHIVTASATAVQNLTKCVIAAGVKIDELVAGGLASAEAVLSPTERDLGVAVADIGAGTTELTLFADGSPFHTTVLPVGGANVTNDIAIGLKTSLKVAESLKIDHGTCDVAGVDPDEVISVTVLGDEAGRTVERMEVCRIIEARMRETYEMLRTEILSAAPGMLPAGLILTGGGAQLGGAAVLGREILEMPVRVAAATEVGGLVDGILEPSYSTAIGLLLWGARHIGAADLTTYESAPAGGLLGRIRGALRSIFPEARGRRARGSRRARCRPAWRADRPFGGLRLGPSMFPGSTAGDIRGSHSRLGRYTRRAVPVPARRARSQDRTVRVHHRRLDPGRPERPPITPEDQRCRCGRIPRTSP